MQMLSLEYVLMPAGSLKSAAAHLSRLIEFTNPCAHQVHEYWMRSVDVAFDRRVTVLQRSSPDRTTERAGPKVAQGMNRGRSSLPYRTNTSFSGPRNCFVGDSKTSAVKLFGP